jgi:hypothetical protein
MKRTLKRESKGLEVVKREWKWGREMRKGWTKWVVL